MRCMRSTCSIRDLAKAQHRGHGGARHHEQLNTTQMLPVYRNLYFKSSTEYAQSHDGDSGIARMTMTRRRGSIDSNHDPDDRMRFVDFPSRSMVERDGRLRQPDV
jgi:hypothetical protein